MEPQDKEDNDYADTAADKGSKHQQKYLAMVAKLFAKRHKVYQGFVRRVQTFIVNMKKEEDELRQKETQGAEANRRKETKRNQRQHHESNDHRDIRLSRLGQRRCQDAHQNQSKHQQVYRLLKRNRTTL